MNLIESIVKKKNFWRHMVQNLDGKNLKEAVTSPSTFRVLD